VEWRDASAFDSFGCKSSFGLAIRVVVKGREVGVKNKIPEQNVVVYQLA
jgi:hypothetical protein